MVSKRILIVFARAGIPGLLIAAALSGQSRISVQIWVSATAVWVVGTVLYDFIAVAAVEPASLVPGWRRSGRRRQRPAFAGARGLQTIHVLLAAAQTTPRAHANQLRPRLIALAKHYLPIRHGFHLEQDPARAADLLGDVAWLIDPAVNEHRPGLAEITKFLDVVLAEQDTTMSAHQRERRVAAT